MTGSAVEPREAGRIRLLSPLVADQIAAGEVIERPASVVKELVENALDADAHEVHIDLEAGGRDRIRVRDDGLGMEQADAERACLRHATSKLQSIEDLSGIGTLGFRGEALASIAAVARVSIHTRARGTQAGTHLRVEEGEVKEAVPAGVPEGTSIEVTDLFATVPARRKFLRTAQTELGHIVEWVQHMALARPEVAFHCTHGKRRMLSYPAVKSSHDRLRQVLGAERVKDMIEVRSEDSDVGVVGFVSRPGTSFAQARNVLTFVGRRRVRDRLLLRAVLDAYRALLPQRRYPAAVIFLDVPGDTVDVNVHPTKTEVRFADPDVVFGAVLRAIRGALAGPGLRAAGEEADGGAIAAAGPSSGEGEASPESARISGALRRYAIRTENTTVSEGPARGDRYAGASGGRRSVPELPLSLGAEKPVAEDHGEASPDPAAGEPPAGPLPEPFSQLRVLGQALNGYIVCAYGDGLVLIDQHAAHERVRFEHLRTRHGESAPSQKLLVPQVVEVGEAARARLFEHEAELERAGFEVDAFGERALMVRAIPASLDVSTRASDLLEQLAEDLADLGVSDRLASARDALAARVACHGAVRVGEGLTREEMERIVADLDTIPFASTCPHGRPLLVQLERAEIERRVLRR